MPAIPDIDINRTATLLICRHGVDAELEAARQADLMLERGDRNGRLGWQRIMQAIAELLASPMGPLH
jgi:hypothetical protein